MPRYAPARRALFVITSGQGRVMPQLREWCVSALVMEALVLKFELGDQRAYISCLAECDIVLALGNVSFLILHFEN